MTIRKRFKEIASKLRAKRNMGRHTGQFHKMVLPRLAITITMLCFAVLCCVFVNDLIGYLPLVVIVLGIILSFIYVRAVGRLFEVDDRSVPHDCLRGEAIDFDLTFVNHSILPVAKLRTSFALTNIFGAVDSTMDTDLALAPHERLGYGFAIDFNHIGEYEVHLDWVRLYDPFGLFWRTRKLDKVYTVSVIPHTYSIDTLEEFSISESASQSTFKPLVTDDMDYAGVRDYVPGDPIKSIHWKLSARSDHYFTRLFESFGIPGVSIFLDFSAPDYDAELMMCAFDSIVESAFSMWEYACEMGMDTEMVFTDKDGMEIRRKAFSNMDVAEILRYMPNLSARISQSQAVETMHHIAGAQHSNDNIVFCTGNVTEELIYTIIELKNRKRFPLLIVSIPQGADQDMRTKMSKKLKQLDIASVPVYLIEQASDLNSKEE